jgi:hypothetical protein
VLMIAAGPLKQRRTRSSAARMHPSVDVLLRELRPRSLALQATANGVLPRKKYKTLQKDGESFTQRASSRLSAAGLCDDNSACRNVPIAVAFPRGIALAIASEFQGSLV